MNAVSPSPFADPYEIETLVGEARDYSRIAEIVAHHLFDGADRRDGNLINPLRAEDEQALFFSIMGAAQAASKLYNRFHQIEERAS